MQNPAFWVFLLCAGIPAAGWLMSNLVGYICWIVAGRPTLEDLQARERALAARRAEFRESFINPKSIGLMAQMDIIAQELRSANASLTDVDRAIHK